MSARETALKYMEIFFKGDHLEDLQTLLNEDFSFEGPFYKFDSAKDYIESLVNDPPVGFSYQL